MKNDQNDLILPDAIVNYESILEYLWECNEEGQEAVYTPQIAEDLGLTRGQIAKALQTGRRDFDFKHKSISNYIMSSPRGLFVVDPQDDIKNFMAYAVQTYKDIVSRVKTFKPLLRHIKENYPNEFIQAIEDSKSEDMTVESDEVEPWAVFNKLTNFPEV